MLDQLEDWADVMRQEINITNFPNGWFSKHMRCTKGSSIFTWILEHIEPDQKKAGVICQKILEKKLINAIEEKKGRIFNINNLYRFFMDSDDIADNQVKRWNSEVGEAIAISLNLVELITDVYQVAFNDEKSNTKQDFEDEDFIDCAAALNSQEYKKYISAASELQKVDILTLDEPQRIALFLNVYQCMYIHNYLIKKSQEDDDSSI